MSTLSPAELLPLLAPLRLEEALLVLVPVNNSRNTTGIGGSHWSLLAYAHEDDTFFHFDSMRSANDVPAAWLAHRLWSVLHGTTKEHTQRVKLVAAQTLQQTNCFECGIFVMSLVAAVLVHCVVVCDKRQAQREEQPSQSTEQPPLCTLLTKAGGITHEQVLALQRRLQDLTTHLMATN
eukprot:TRINITY_DN4163_c0_g2_i1.p2 TRINITY_DN4163_c0_g2~~TRINITY_DN4163_c0_g2_i1.p2  ORF type:complete len:179 (-),score=46.44 TRINITY_DN4163_c0_g2_i1:111-647(-)